MNNHEVNQGKLWSTAVIQSRPLLANDQFPSQNLQIQSI